MIKRLSKAKKSKQGAILVIVVLILALAMIFIASAMMLTQATRRRLYSRTMSSQARLTVTSASEVFLEALKTQEISDAQIDALLAKKAARATSNDQKIKMVVAGVPGMSEDPNNCTYVDIYKDPANAELVYADFSTVIGDEKPENVRVVLREGESEPSLGHRFMNQIEVSAHVGIAELRFTSGVGMWNKTKYPTSPSDNTIVMRGGIKTQTSGSVVFSEIIFGEGASIALGGGDVYNNNVVFLDNTTMIGRSSMTIKGDIYFIGKTHNTAGMSVPASGTYANNIDLWGGGIKSTNFVFSGRGVQNDTVDQNHKIKDIVTNSSKKCYFVDSNGNCLTSGGTKVTKKSAQSQSGDTYEVDNAGAGTSGVPTGITNNVKRYQKYDYNSSSNPFPSAASVFKTLNPDGKVQTVTQDGGITLSYTTYSKDGKKTYAAGSVIPKGDTYVVNPVTAKYPTYKREGGVATGAPEKTLNLSNLSSEATDRLLVLDPGYYYVTGNSQTVTTTSDNSNLKPYVIAIDGANADKYRFYFAKDHTFFLNLCVFAVYNVQDPGVPVVFIMEEGAKIQLSGANYRVNSSNNILCTSGFLSMSRAATAGDLKTYIHSTSYASESKNWSDDYKKNDNTTIIKYSKLYDSIHTPSIFIYGAKNNKLVFSDSTILEAYVGLYDNGAFGVLDGTASVIPIYGRIEANEVHGYKNDNSFGVKDDTPVGDISMPYCPQPNQASGMPSKRPAKSKYSVASMIYYYDNNAATPTTI